MRSHIEIVASVPCIEADPEIHAMGTKLSTPGCVQLRMCVSVPIVFDVPELQVTLVKLSPVGSVHSCITVSLPESVELPWSQTLDVNISAPGSVHTRVIVLLPFDRVLPALHGTVTNSASGKDTFGAEQVPSSVLRPIPNGPPGSHTESVK